MAERGFGNRSAGGTSSWERCNALFQDVGFEPAVSVDSTVRVTQTDLVIA